MKGKVGMGCAVLCRGIGQWPLGIHYISIEVGIQCGGSYWKNNYGWGSPTSSSHPILSHTTLENVAEDRELWHAVIAVSSSWHLSDPMIRVMWWAEMMTVLWPLFSVCSLFIIYGSELYCSRRCHDVLHENLLSRGFIGVVTGNPPVCLCTPLGWGEGVMVPIWL